MRRYYAVAALTLLIAHSAVPQQPQDASGPNIQETAQWVVDNLAKYLGGTYFDPNYAPGNPDTYEEYGATANITVTLYRQSHSIKEKCP
jgi:hypothetical protein